MYTTKENIEAYLMTTIDASYNAQIDEWISAVDNFIDNYTGREEDGFLATEKTKYYDGNGEREILLDSFTSITTLQILSSNSSGVEYTLTEGLDNDFVTKPANSASKYKVKLTANSSVGNFMRGLNRVKVTGKFGYANTVPSDINLIATILVSEVIKEGKDGGLIASQSLGDYSVSFDKINQVALRITDVRNVLNTYRLIEL